MFKWDILIINAKLATMSDGANSYGMIENGAIAITNEEIQWVGSSSSLNKIPNELAKEVIDAQRNLVTPGLIDCHTHLVFAGNRSDEFEQRLNGISYEEIAKQGGGILSTVRATREASFDELYQQSLPRFQALMNEGVTTIEIKSGYGLNLDSEIKMLQVAKKLGEDYQVQVKTTLLAAHAVPSEYKGNADGYIDLICSEIIPKVASLKLADCVDAFCEGIGFSYEQTKKVFDAAVRWGLPVKLHADQLSDLNGAALVAEYSGLSADHVEYTNSKSVKAMSKSGTVAVLLPYAFYILKETKLPPIEDFRKYNVPMAVSTDCNPGTAPSSSLLTTMNKACVEFSLTPVEVLAGVTVHAAMALGVEDEVGSIEVGKKANLVLWNCQNPADLCYWQGMNRVERIIK
ncbi:MAG TPA: imidazolonepropionase [Gammaproteobacteria bacterium]|nr:imidazolonepropionase [Xanthomonadales bacterium]HOP21470.1 imidazolonepropionase [Gammaproteobacteria bacterium]HPI95480.1 imidazolonepropionase [Gammaproteobacteria bacterium]HPQ87223.1 imidazolonepropionase [Gammaproteobacteria bacterium]